LYTCWFTVQSNLLLYIPAGILMVTEHLEQQIMDICRWYWCGRRRMVAFSCHYRHIFTTAVKMTVFICHRDYVCCFILVPCLFMIFSVPAVCRQMVHIHSYIPAWHNSQLYTDRKERAYPADRKGKVYGRTAKHRLSVRCRDWGNDRYENTWVTKKKRWLKITYYLMQTKFLIISRTREYDCTYEHYLT